MAPLGNPQKPILAKNYLIWAKDGKEDTFLVHFSEIAFEVHDLYGMFSKL